MQMNFSGFKIGVQCKTVNRVTVMLQIHKSVKTHVLFINGQLF